MAVLDQERPDRILDLILGYRQAKVLLVAAYYRLFDLLDAPRSASELAAAKGLDPRAGEILLDALAALGLLVKTRGRYRNEPMSSRFLVSGRPGYLGDNLRYQELIWDAWSGLRRVLKSGRAERPLEHWLKEHESFTEEYIRGMDNIARRPAEEIASFVRPHQARGLLDVGAGPGTYSLACLRRGPRLTATLLDLPTTLAVTRRLVDAHPELSPRVRLKPADYRAADFGRGAYDLVLMSHITHDESPEVNQRLLAKGFRALRPGGRLVIHDFLVRPDRTAPLFGALFSVHMLTYTEGGRTYTAGEYGRWLKIAGFSSVRRRKIAINSRNSTEILVATKLN